MGTKKSATVTVSSDRVCSRCGRQMYSMYVVTGDIDYTWYFCRYCTPICNELKHVLDDILEG